MMNLRDNTYPLATSVSPYELTADEIGLLLETFMHQWEVDNGQ